jgi:hypothetical protein
MFASYVSPFLFPGGRRSAGSAFMTEYAVVDRIIRHLGLTFIAEKRPAARHSKVGMNKGSAKSLDRPAHRRER